MSGYSGKNECLNYEQIVLVVAIATQKCLDGQLRSFIEGF